jgi:putative holliday junction resolvase
LNGPGRLLSLDLGLRRTGLARSDPDRTISIGLPTFENTPGRSLKEHLRLLHGELPLSGVVLGYPLHDDGRPSDLAPRVLRLAVWLHAELRLPVALWDERRTTVAAEDRLREAPRRVRRAKGTRDRLAAQLILQEFLDAGSPFPDEAEIAAWADGPLPGADSGGRDT